MYFNRICLIRELDLTRSEPTARISLLWFIIQMKTEFRLLVQYKGLIQNSLFAVVGPRGWGPKSSLYCSCNLPCSSHLYVSMYLFIVACIFSVVVVQLSLFSLSKMKVLRSNKKSVQKSFINPWGYGAEV